MPTPTIKGMFINSHLKALEAQLGTDGLTQLGRAYGKPLVFKNLEDVPVREEVEILTHMVPLLCAEVSQTQIDFEAGRLHFRNFITTPFAKILMGAIPRTSEGYNKMLQSSDYIASHVFKHMRFGSEPSEEKTLVSIIENSDYPRDHFKGLFYEWMLY